MKIENCYPPEVPNHLSADAKDFITQCLNYDKDKRPSAL